MEPTSKKTKSRPKLNPTESAALQRLEHDLITDSGTVPATKGRHAIHCLTVIGTIEGHTLAPDAQKTKIFCSFLHTMVRNYEKNLDKKLTI